MADPVVMLPCSSAVVNHLASLALTRQHLPYFSVAITLPKQTSATNILANICFSRVSLSSSKYSPTAV